MKKFFIFFILFTLFYQIIKKYLTIRDILFIILIIRRINMRKLIVSLVLLSGLVVLIVGKLEARLPGLFGLLEGKYQKEVSPDYLDCLCLRYKFLFVEPYSGVVEAMKGRREVSKCWEDCYPVLLEYLTYQRQFPDNFELICYYDWFYIKDKESFFAHSSDPNNKNYNNRIRNTEEYSCWLMDITNFNSLDPTDTNYYMGYLANRIEYRRSGGGGFPGVALLYSNTPDEAEFIPDNYNEITWKQAVETAIWTIRRKINYNRFFFIDNTSLLKTDLNDTFLFTLGGILKNFALNLEEPYNITEEKWKSQVQELLRLQWDGFRAVAFTEVIGKANPDSLSKERIFALASYYLSDFNRLYFYFMDYSLPFKEDLPRIQYYPEWDVDLGFALESYSVVDSYYKQPDGIFIKGNIGLYGRIYENGSIWINPADSKDTVKLSFPDTVYHIYPLSGGTLKRHACKVGSVVSLPETDVSVPPKEAVILLNYPVALDVLSPEFILDDLLCYPNPAFDILTIRFNGNLNKDEKAYVFDLNGKLVKSFDLVQKSNFYEVRINLNNEKDLINNNLLFIKVKDNVQKILILRK